MKKCNAVFQGNKAELHARCNLLPQLIYYGLEKLVYLSNTELRSMSEELTLTFGSETSKDNLIMNVSNEMIKNEDGIADLMLALIGIEEENEY